MLKDLFDFCLSLTLKIILSIICSGAVIYLPVVGGTPQWLGENQI